MSSACGGRYVEATGEGPRELKEPYEHDRADRDIIDSVRFRVEGRVVGWALAGASHRLISFFCFQL